SGQTGDDTVTVGVDSRVPGTLTAPKAGDTVAGLAVFAFQPTSVYPVTEVSLGFDTGSAGLNIFNASPDGVWRTSAYTGSLPSGPNVLRPFVTSTDAFGATHYWAAPGTPLVIDSTSLPLAVSADPDS